MSCSEKLKICVAKSAGSDAACRILLASFNSAYSYAGKGTIIRMKNSLKIAAAILAIVFIAGIFIIARYADRAQSSFEGDSKEEGLAELQAERLELLSKLEDRKEELSREQVGDGHMMIMFTSPDELIYTDVYPISAGLPGNIVLWRSDMPSNDGNITWDQLRELTGAGWGICLGFDGEDDPSAWSDEMQNALSAEGISSPSAVYLADGKYTDSLGAALKNLGYNTVIHHGETGELSCTSVTDNLWLPGAAGWYSENSSSMPKTIAQNGGSLVFTVGFNSEGTERYDHERYASLVNRLLSFKEQYKLETAAMSTAFNYYVTLTEANNKRDAEDTEIVRLEKLLDECERKLYEVYGVSSDETDNSAD